MSFKNYFCFHINTTLYFPIFLLILSKPIGLYRVLSGSSTLSFGRLLLFIYIRDTSPFSYSTISLLPFISTLMDELKVIEITLPIVP